MYKGLIALDLAGFELIYGAEIKGKIAQRVELLAEPMWGNALVKRPDLLAQVEVIFSGWGAPEMTAEFLAQAPNLKAVFYGAGSVRYFTTDAFWARDIAITSAYAMNAVPVAEYTLATILLSLKSFFQTSAKIREIGAYPKRPVVAGGFGSKVGLISLGMIGRLVRERLRPFDLEVLAYDPFLTAEQAASLGVKQATLEEIFEQCDVVSLHAPSLKETEGMITGRLVGTMKPNATFINTARGKLVREEELIEVLRVRKDLTAILDVTDPEPPVADSPFWALPNLILTPHIAGSMDNECRRMGSLMVDEFDRWNRGEPMQWGLTQAKAALMA
jgi:phosphoglycerate dehydrogenase-like enzyme